MSQTYWKQTSEVADMVRGLYSLAMMKPVASMQSCVRVAAAGVKLCSAWSSLSYGGIILQSAGFPVQQIMAWFDLIPVAMMAHAQL